MNNRWPAGGNGTGREVGGAQGKQVNSCYKVQGARDDVAIARGNRPAQSDSVVDYQKSKDNGKDEFHKSNLYRSRVSLVIPPQKKRPLSPRTRPRPVGLRR